MIQFEFADLQPASMAPDLTQYGIIDAIENVYNPSYEFLIEAQQKMLEYEGKFQPRGLQGDEALVHFRKVFNSLLKEEWGKYSFHTLKVGNTII